MTKSHISLSERDHQVKNNTFANYLELYGSYNDKQVYLEKIK